VGRPVYATAHGRLGAQAVFTCFRHHPRSRPAICQHSRVFFVCHLLYNVNLESDQAPRHDHRGPVLFLQPNTLGRSTVSAPLPHVFTGRAGTQWPPKLANSLCPELLMVPPGGRQPFRAVTPVQLRPIPLRLSPLGTINSPEGISGLLNLPPAPRTSMGLPPPPIPSNASIVIPAKWGRGTWFIPISPSGTNDGLCNGPMAETGSSIIRIAHSRGFHTHYFIITNGNQPR